MAAVESYGLINRAHHYKVANSSLYTGPRHTPMRHPSARNACPAHGHGGRKPYDRSTTTSLTWRTGLTLVKFGISAASAAACGASPAISDSSESL